MPPRKGNRRKSGKNPAVQTQTADEGWDAFFQSLTRLEQLLVVGAILLLLLLIYTIQSILSPFLVLGAIVFLLYPMRTYTLPRNLMWLSIFLFLLWFVYSISSILAPFILSFLLAYLLNPMVTRLAEWKIPRWLSSLFMILLSIGLIVLVLFFVLPIAVSQFEGLLEAVSGLFNNVREWLMSSKFNSYLERYGISADEIRATLTSRLTPSFEEVARNLLEASLTVVSSVTEVATQVFYLILVPFLTFYLLTDFPKISRQFLMLFPSHRRSRAEDYMLKADQLIGRYMRGALTVALLQGVIVVLLFSLYEIKYALLLGMLAALLDLIPYFGLIITMVLAAIVAALSEGEVLQKVLLAVATIGVLHLVEVTFLAPRIVGGRVGLHPLIIILSLLVFAYFLGFIGLLIAVPTTALVILLVREWEAIRRGVPLGQFHSSKNHS